MASPDDADSRVFQRFGSEDGEELANLPVHFCAETGRRYIFWSDIQSTFPGVVLLRDQSSDMVLFMIDQDGELCHPLCIENHLGQSFTVVYDAPQKQQSEGSQHRGQADDDSLTIMSTADSGPNTFAPVTRLFEAAGEIGRRLDSRHARNDFLRMSANARHYQRMLLKEIDKEERTGIKVMVDSKDGREILNELQERIEQLPQSNHENIYWNTLARTSDICHTATSRLFIVLPCGLDSWIASDISTHRFRLYFLCDFWADYRFDLPEHVPKHVHFANHPGYALNRPLEFFHEYGDYVLRVLEMIKHGYSAWNVKAPPLDTFQILWGCDPYVIGSHLSKEIIGDFIDKAIEYIHSLSPHTWRSNLSLTYSQSVAIKSYLDVQEGDDAEGNLCRNIDAGQVASWVCQAHSKQCPNQDVLDDLIEFVDSRRGRLDMRQATIRVELDSVIDADRFRALLTDTKFRFDISVKLKWEATPVELEKFCKGLTESEGVVLEIDGVSSNIHPQDHSRLRIATSFQVIKQDVRFRLVALPNFPRLQEHFLYIDDIELRLDSPPKGSYYEWIELRSELTKFVETVSMTEESSECKAASLDLQSALTEHGLPRVTALTFRAESWIGVFDLAAGIYVEVYSYHMYLPNIVASTGSVPTLAGWLFDESSGQEFYRFVQGNDALLELSIRTPTCDVLQQLEFIGELHHHLQKSLQIILFDVTEELRGRIVTQATIHPENPTSNGSSLIETEHVNNLSLSASHQEHGEEPPMAFDISRWDRDYILAPLSDYCASFFDMATKQHPSVLTSFSLDISRCSEVGLVSIQNILSQSSLEHIAVVCTPFNPIPPNSISRILQRIPWSTLKSLVITGDSIDEWIQLWPYPSPMTLQLLSFQIRGTGSVMQELSHSSMLFVHHIVFASPLAELSFGNVQLQDKHDWDSVLESMDSCVAVDASNHVQDN